MRRSAPWIAVWGLTLALTGLTSFQSLRAYREFRSGWAWDLAYSNQWLWALLWGDQVITVRPLNSWGTEGPSIWTRTHLDPIRIAVAPFYALWPGPEVLLVAHNALMWLVVPAAFSLVRSETKSNALALSGATLVPFTPLLWPMLWNDFREMEVGIPFVLWAVQGYRSRSRWLAIAGCVGMLASREEFGVMVASFAILPPREEEDIGTTFAWSRASVYVGVAWVVFAFLGFQTMMVARTAPEAYLSHFGGPKPTVIQTLPTLGDMLVFGLGPWALLALAAPRMTVLAFPWLWGVCNGRWSLDFLADFRWHHVRYASPIVALFLAAGLIGHGRLGSWMLRKRRGGWLLAGAWLLSAGGLSLSTLNLLDRMSHIEWPVSRQEAREIWTWIDRVDPDDAVLASYEVCAPLSSRKSLYSDRLQPNRPRGYPQLGPEFRWVFLRKGDLAPEVLTAQGFEIVHRGESHWIYRREAVAPSAEAESP